MLSMSDEVVYNQHLHVRSFVAKMVVKAAVADLTLASLGNVTLKGLFPCVSHCSRKPRQVHPLLNFALVFASTLRKCKWIFIILFSSVSVFVFVRFSHSHVQQLSLTILDFQGELWYFGHSFGYISRSWAIFFNVVVTPLANVAFVKEPQVWQFSKDDLKLSDFKKLRGSRSFPEPVSRKVKSESDLFVVWTTEFSPQWLDH